MKMGWDPLERVLRRDLSEEVTSGTRTEWWEWMTEKNEEKTTPGARVEWRKTWHIHGAEANLSGQSLVRTGVLGMRGAEKESLA